ncbi:MAG TPA: hypothetical protein VFR67_27005 [Pilimelia sp.]|nr:hypothetical protein [Pilimelia sp.]
MAYPVRPPPVDPRVLRPRRGWYVLAGIIAGLSLLAAPVLLIVGVGAIGSVEDTLPTMTAEFDADTPATVELTAARRWAIYVEEPATDPTVTPDQDPDLSPEPSPEPSDAQCTVEAVAGGTADVTAVTHTVHVTVDGRTWRQLHTFTVSQAGTYRVTCEPTGPGAGPHRYAVGEDVNLAGLLGRIFGGIGSIFAAILVPCTGLFLAGLLALIVGLRRYLHRKRLQQI